MTRRKIIPLYMACRHEARPGVEEEHDAVGEKQDREGADEAARARKRSAAAGKQRPGDIAGARIAGASHAARNGRPSPGSPHRSPRS